MAQGQVCTKGDGTAFNKACNVDGTCVASSGLTCDTTTGLCAKTQPGKKGDTCYTDAMCDAKWPGLHCTVNSGTTAGLCDCTPASKTLQKCTDDSICIPGGSPPPPPPVTPWPTDPLFNVPPPSDEWKSKYTGLCSASQWYLAPGMGTCPASTLAAKTVGATPALQCIDQTAWNKGALAASFSDVCYLPKAR